MQVQDPISDMLARIENANHRRHESLDMPGSKQEFEICKVLEEEGYVEDCELEDREGKQNLHIEFRYQNGDRIIEGLERVSKPSRRVYVSKEEIPKVLGGLGTAILTTSRGIMTGKEASEEGIGGELLLKIW